MWAAAYLVLAMAQMESKPTTAARNSFEKGSDITSLERSVGSRLQVSCNPRVRLL